MLSFKVRKIRRILRRLGLFSHINLSLESLRTKSAHRKGRCSEGQTDRMQRSVAQVINVVTNTLLLLYSVAHLPINDLFSFHLAEDSRLNPLIPDLTAR